MQRLPTLETNRTDMPLTSPPTACYSLDQGVKYHPFSLSVKDAAKHFGFHPKTLYDWISQGRLHRGKHYLKIGKKVLIVRHAFIEFLYKEDGSNGNGVV